MRSSARALRLLLGAVSIVTIVTLAAGAAGHQPAGAGLGPRRSQVPGDAFRATSAPVVTVLHVAKRSSADVAGAWLAGIVMIGLGLMALVAAAAAAGGPRVATRAARGRAPPLLLQIA